MIINNFEHSSVVILNSKEGKSAAFEKGVHGLSACFFKKANDDTFASKAI